MLTTSVAGLCLFNACCTYATVFSTLLKLLNRSHWITVFFLQPVSWRLMRVYSLHPMQRLGSFSLAIHFLVASTRPAQWGTHFSWVPQCWLLWCQCPLGCWYRPHVSTVKHQLYPVSHPFDWPQTLSGPLQYCSWVWPKTATIYLHFMLLDYLFFQPHCHDCRLQSIALLKDASSVPLCFFQWQMLSQLGILLVVNVDRPLHTTCLLMRQQTHEVRF